MESLLIFFMNPNTKALAGSLLDADLVAYWSKLFWLIVFCKNES